jgi:hypothetical protein
MRTVLLLMLSNLLFALRAQTADRMGEAPGMIR